MPTLTFQRGLIAAFALLIQTGALAAGAADQIEIVNPYARAMPPGQPNSALFMTLKNHGNADHALVDASSPVAERVELHNHIHDKGVMRMRRVDRIRLPAGDSTALEPGGYHVMLIGLRQPLTPDAEVPFELSFADGSQTAAVAPVRSIVQTMEHRHMHDHDAGRSD